MGAKASQDAARSAAKDAGFTLMEVLAALVIFSVSVVGLLGSSRQSVRVASEVELKTLGGIAADNAVAQTLADLAQPGAVGAGLDTLRPERVEVLGREFEVSYATDPIEGADLTELVVDVREVVGRDAGRVVSSRTAFVVPPRAPEPQAVP